MPVAILLILGMLVATIVIIHGRSPVPVGMMSAPVPLSALSPDLGAYAKNQGNDMGVVVYDLSRSHYYAYNQDTPFILASSAKVYILAAYLDQLEMQGRHPTVGEVNLLARMIENSDNDAAQSLYSRIGYDVGQRRFLEKIGITSYIACPDGWGCAKLPPLAMAQILTLLEQGRILNGDDRTLAFNLMGNIEADQRMGVGTTAPRGAIYYMKDGWWPIYDNYSDWALNSSGIIQEDSETYIISIYSQHQTSEDWSKIEHVCSLVAALLA